VGDFKKLFARRPAKISADPLRQLEGARNAVFESWMNPRASITESRTRSPTISARAVNVQSMVFGKHGR